MLWGRKKMLLTLLSALLKTDPVLLATFEFVAFQILSIWHSLKCLICITLSQTIPGFYVSAVQVFWQHCEKRIKYSLQAISPFLTLFSTRLKNFLPFSSIWNCHLQTHLVLKILKFVIWERVKNYMFSHGPYSRTILKNILSLCFQDFLNLKGSLFLVF